MYKISLEEIILFEINLKVLYWVKRAHCQITLLLEIIRKYEYNY